jgi:thiol-disulfide isomerase/thioredoxin
LQGRENQGLSLLDSSDYNSEGNIMSLILGLATVGLLAAVVFYLKKISEQQTQVIRRIEVLELISHEGGREVERENLASPTEGLPIGAVAPDFELPDLNGKIVEFEHLLAQAKPLLFLFVSPNCNPCAALLPEIEAWQEELKGKLNFIFISSGKAKENLDKFAGETLKQILLQKERETAELFGAQWTPTAVLINTDGRIASRVAAGDKAIRELVEKIKAEDLDKELVYVVNTNGNGSSAKLGEHLPEFSNTDVFDKNITSKDLLGKKTLVTFWSQTCPHCVNMLEDLRQWDKAKGADEPNLLMLSDGTVESLRELEINSPVVLDKERKISKELGWNGTPSAVLLDEEGKIISETAIGASNIWALLGKRK